MLPFPEGLRDRMDVEACEVDLLAKLEGLETSERPLLVEILLVEVVEAQPLTWLRMRMRDCGTAAKPWPWGVTSSCDGPWGLVKGKPQADRDKWSCFNTYKWPKINGWLGL